MQFNRLKRRDLITLLGGAAAAGTSPLAALARAFDKRPRRIAYLSGGSRAGTDKVVTAFSKACGRMVTSRAPTSRSIIIGPRATLSAY
jgi:hypothetical protein